MIVDEIDLVKRALEVETPSPSQQEDARARLMAHMAGASDIRVARRGRGLRGFGAGLGAAAAGAAVIFAVTSTSQPATAPNPPSASTQQPVTVTPAIESQLVSLASRLTASQVKKPSGDASLVIRTQKIGDRPAVENYDLFTDEGAYYYGESREGLEGAVTRGEDLSDGGYARKIRAASYAADGDLEIARTKMVNTMKNFLGLGLSEEERQRIWDEGSSELSGDLQEFADTLPANPPVGEDLRHAADNLVWINATDALRAGVANPRVRAGFLRLMSTIPEVKVEEAITEGKASLVLTAGEEVFGGGTTETLIVDAATGMPISSYTKSLEEGIESGKSVYAVSRVRLADLKTGQ